MHLYYNYTVKPVVLCCSIIRILGLERFPIPNLNHNSYGLKNACKLSKLAEPYPGFIAICGYQGDSCSIAVYKNQTEAQIHKHINCGCLDQVFPRIYQSYQTVPAPDYSFATNGDTSSGHNVIATFMNGASVKTSSGRTYVELDGVDDYTDLGSNSNNCLGNVELCSLGLTLSMWVWPTKLNSEPQWYFGTSKVGKMRLIIRLKNQILQAALHTTSSRWKSESYQPTGKWTLITVTWIQNGVFSVYIDGCLFEAVGGIVWPNTPESHRTVIGKHVSLNDKYAGIKLDEFMFWEKVLEPAEVMSVFISDP